MKDKIILTKRRLESTYGVTIPPDVLDFVTRLHEVSERATGFLALPEMVDVDWARADEDGSELFTEFYSWVSRSRDCAASIPECSSAVEYFHKLMVEPDLYSKTGPRIPRGYLYLAGSAVGSRLLVRPDGHVILSLIELEELGDPLGCCVDLAEDWQRFSGLCKPPLKP